ARRARAGAAAGAAAAGSRSMQSFSLFSRTGRDEIDTPGPLRRRSPRRSQQTTSGSPSSLRPVSRSGVGAGPRAPDRVRSRAHSRDPETGVGPQGVAISEQRPPQHPALAHLEHAPEGQVQAQVGRWKTEPRSRQGPPKATPVDIVVGLDDFAFVDNLAVRERGEARRVTGSDRLLALQE